MPTHFRPSVPPGLWLCGSSSRLPCSCPRPGRRSTAVSLVFYLPAAAWLLAQGSLAGPALGYSVAAGVLCSVVPYAADLISLRTIQPAFFGVYMSINPVLAALSGTVVLGQFLVLHEWLGIVVIVATNAAAILLAARRSRRSLPAGSVPATPE